MSSWFEILGWSGVLVALAGVVCYDYRIALIVCGVFLLSVAILLIATNGTADSRSDSDR
jgi:hypothetical protein